MNDATPTHGTNAPDGAGPGMPQPGQQPGRLPASPGTPQPGQPQASPSPARRRVPAVLLAAVLITALAVGGLLAKYVMDHQREVEVIAAGFHISSNALQQVEKDATPPTYTAVCSFEGTFDVDIYNWEVENADSISDLDVPYTVTVKDADTGATIANAVASVTDEDGDAVAAVGGVYTIAGEDEHAHTLAINPGTAKRVSVTATTTGPYVKTITANFDVSPGRMTAYTRDVGGGVTQVVVETNQYEGPATLTWADGLLPNPGVDEDSYGWSITYQGRLATRDVERQATYYFEFNGTTIAGVSVSGTEIAVR